MQPAALFILSTICEISASADTTTSLIESTSEIIFHTQAVGEDSTSTSLQSSLSTTTPNACSGDANLTSICPTCNGKPINVDQDDEYVVFCDSDFTSVTYNEIYFFARPTLSQCVSACSDADGCYAPVIGPGGRCFQALNGPDDDPLLSNEPGYIALLPRFLGSSPPPSGIHILPPKPRSTSPHPATSSKPLRQCNITNLSCPRCDNKNVEDADGTTYKVLCNNEIYANHHFSVPDRLSPEECMVACNDRSDCGGSTYWSNGECELGWGENVFPQSKLGRTAFLSIDPNFTPPPPQLSAFPTEPASPAFSSTPPGLEGCKRPAITCPQCDGLCLEDDLKSRYTVRCDLQPICKRTQGRYNVRSATACVKRCDAEEGCEAAIYERGKCVTCEGTLESFTPYVLPHSYVVVLAEPTFLGPVLSSL